MSLISLLDELRAIVEPETSGTTRRFPSEAYLNGRRWVREKMESLGLSVTIDAAGNMFGRREGSQPDAPAILVGSHTDTVFAGGHLDGALGVLAALEVARTVGPLRHPLVVVDFLAEEANDFGISCVGSRCLAGTFQRDWLDRAAHGQTLGKAMAEAGGDPERLDNVALAVGKVHGMLELHIEQGPVLENAGISVGAVSGIVGITRATLQLHGQADHAGTAPMGLRKDALAAAAELISALETMVKGVPGAAGTVGRLEVHPNQSNVVPGRVEMIPEVRHLQAHLLEALWEGFLQSVEVICERRGIGLEVGSTTRTLPAQPPNWLLDVTTAACRSVDPGALVLPSGAGHDCGHMSAHGSAMLFVPSIGGRSHCPQEATAPEHLEAGLAALRESVIRLDAVDRSEF